MQTGRSRSARAACSLRAENDVTHTLSQARVRRSTSIMGLMAGTSFRSMLNRSPGQALIRSSISGIGSVPLIRAAAISRYCIRAIRPVRSVARSRVRS
jgi:H+/gluconate symporter-like permease